MNRFRALADAVQSAAIAAHGTDPDSAASRLLRTVEAQLAAALPDTASAHRAYMMRQVSTCYAAHLASLGQMPGPTCSCPWFCRSLAVVEEQRHRILTLGLTPGDPVVEVGFSSTTGSVWVQRLFVRGCGGPHAGDYLGGGADGDTCGRSGNLTNRTTDPVERLLLRQGWRVVTFDEAAEALTSVGFHLGGGCGDLDRFHALRPDETGPGRWRVTNPDCDAWTQRAIAVRCPTP